MLYIVFDNGLDTYFLMWKKATTGNSAVGTEG